MATVIGKTSQKIDELLTTLLQGVITFVEITPERNLIVRMSDGTILNMGPVGVSSSTFDAAIDELHTALVANDVSLAELSTALGELNEETLPALNEALAANQTALAAVINVTLPGLQTDLADAAQAVADLNTQVITLTTDTGTVSDLVDLIEKSTRLEHKIY